jgi:hypothetical protein
MTWGKLALAVGAALGVVAVLSGKDDLLRYIKMRQM